MRHSAWSVWWWSMLVTVAGCRAMRSDTARGPDTQVLVVATVHGQHQRNPHYTYADVVRILDTFDPDVVCVEIRPEQFRKEPYLREMMLATVWGVEHGRQVCGFDWYDASARAARAELLEQPAIVAKQQLFDSLIAANPITGPFDRRYGDYWSGEQDYRFYNGPEYNRYFAEWYRISLAIFGDSPINLNYELRNRRMMDRAWDVIRRHAGAKVALLTGSEHKHYFDRDLAARPGITVVELASLLPLRETPPDPAIAAFLEEDDDLRYYAPGYPADTNRYYANKLTGLVHGPDMDSRPDIIPARNVAVAAKVLRRWRASLPASPRLTFDEAWVRFLAGDCATAVDQLATLARQVDAGTVADPFVRVFTFRNLGLCDDLLGRRPQAVRAYARARALMRDTEMAARADGVLHDFETVPYARGRTAPSPPR